MVVYFEAICLVEKLIHHLLCQDDSKGFYNHNSAIFTISSKLEVCFQPDMVWWYSIISWRVLWENRITAFKASVTAKVQNVTWMIVQIVSSEPQNILSPNLVCLCSIISQSVMQKNWFSILNVKVTARACHGHSEGSYNQNMSLSFLSSKLLVGLQSNLVWQCSIINRSVLWKNGIYCV